MRHIAAYPAATMESRTHTECSPWLTLAGQLALAVVSDTFDSLTAQAEEEEANRKAPDLYCVCTRAEISVSLLLGAGGGFL